MNIYDFWKAVLDQNEIEIRKYFQNDAYINWHCTNERFNVDEFIIANCEYPGDWEGSVERVEMLNDLIVTVVNVYPKGRNASFHVTSFIKTKEDKIAAGGSTGCRCCPGSRGQYLQPARQLPNLRS